MNANELADKLDDIPVNDFESLDQHHYTRESATMLRQQQEQINNLKQWEKRQLDVIEALKVDNKQLTEWLTKVGFVK
jgi:predicted lipoprotein